MHGRELISLRRVPVGVEAARTYRRVPGMKPKILSFRNNRTFRSGHLAPCRSPAHIAERLRYDTKLQ